MKRVIPLILAILLVACGGGYNSLDDAIAGEDCTVTSHGASMFSTDEVHCADGTMISWHASERDRNMYAEFVEELTGVGPSEQGDNYNIYRD